MKRGEGKSEAIVVCACLVSGLSLSLGVPARWTRNGASGFTFQQRLHAIPFDAKPTRFGRSETHVETRSPPTVQRSTISFTSGREFKDKEYFTRKPCPISPERCFGIARELCRHFNSYLSDHEGITID